MATTADKKTPSEAKSKVASTKPRIGGRFVSADGRTKSAKAKVETEETYKITEEDRLSFGSDSKAFFEWALTKAATRYEAAKYAKELMRFQYPALQSMEIQQEVTVNEAKVKWIWGEAGDVIESISDVKEITTDHGRVPDTLQAEQSPGTDTQELETV
jgi:hypothetical protein